MFFSVRELERKRIEYDVTFPPGEIEFLDKKLRQTGPLHAAGSAELIHDSVGEIRVRGHLAVDMEADCDRCLERAAVPIASEFDLFYRPESFRPTGDEVEIDSGEAEVGFYEGGGLLLEDVLREHVLLSMPMQKICSEACQGICPVCGRNRNEGHCGCEVKPADDRWAALKNL